MLDNLTVLILSRRGFFMPQLLSHRDCDFAIPLEGPQQINFTTSKRYYLYDLFLFKSLLDIFFYFLFLVFICFMYFFFFHSQNMTYISSLLYIYKLISKQQRKCCITVSRTSVLNIHFCRHYPLVQWLGCSRLLGGYIQSIQLVINVVLFVFSKYTCIIYDTCN